MQAKPASRSRRFWKWLAFSVFLAALVFGFIAAVVIQHAGSILKGRVVETLRARFGSDVSLDTLDIAFTHGIDVTGRGLRVAPPDDALAAGVVYPLVTIRQFDFHASLTGLFLKPMHVGVVHVTGVAIHIPPRELRSQGVSSAGHDKQKIKVDEIVCDDSVLFIDTIKPGKDPQRFVLQHIVLHDVGPNIAWPYDAKLINSLPRGYIHAIGEFGPWHRDSPGDSPLHGRYTFDHADLNTIHGLGGMLSSTGQFTGQLNRIVVDGATDTPNFQLDTAKHPLPLTTHFHAIVDGTTGDTYLQPVNAQLASSAFTCTGAVVNVKGQGHTIDLDVHIADGQLRDFLTLAVRTQPPVMTSLVTAHAVMHIPPGHESVPHRIRMQGAFTLTRMHFTHPQMQDKVDMLSLRAQGRPRDAQPGAPDVRSRMTGVFALHQGIIDLPHLDYALPGATVQLAGVYTLDGSRFDFHGKVRTQAKISQMTSTWWKSILLKGVDPFFHKRGAGAEIPIKITGTESAPKFGLDLGSKDK